MRKRVKVFSSSSNPGQVGDELTDNIEAWISSQNNQINIIDVHSNSNKYGWMVILIYEVIV